MDSCSRRESVRVSRDRRETPDVGIAEPTVRATAAGFDPFRRVSRMIESPFERAQRNRVPLPELALAFLDGNGDLLPSEVVWLAVVH